MTLDFGGEQSGSLAIFQGDERKASEKFAGELFPAGDDTRRHTS